MNRAWLAAAALVLAACGSATPPPPSALMSVVPAPTVPVLGSLRIPFEHRPMDVAIVGEPGIVVAWRAARPDELEALAWADAGIALGRLSERDLVLGWSGTVCDLTATLTIAPGSLEVTPAPRPGCDAMAVGRAMVLTFAEPTDPAAISVELGEVTLLPEAT